MSFNYQFKPLVLNLKLEGDFRSGTKFDLFKHIYHANVESTIQVELDLTKVIYMDSDTMEFIFNHKGSKIMPLDSKVTERYLDYVSSRHEVEVK